MEMIENKEINLKIDTKELQELIEDAIVKHIEQIIYKYLNAEYSSRSDVYDFERKIIALLKKSIRETVEKYSTEFRREVKQEVIDRAVKNITELDKKELLKGLLK